MNVGMTGSSGSSNLCQKLTEELKQHSIYILNDDSDTDFDFFVLVDSEEARNGIKFLDKLHKYITTNNVDEREKLLNSLKDDDPGLKILIEKYPYRLFVAIDENDAAWKVNDKAPLDNGFDWTHYKSEFIKKRICWISKEDLQKAFLEDNKDILKVEEVDEEGNPKNSKNILEDDKKFTHYDRAKLWLYYKWVEHLMKNNCIEKLDIYIEFGPKSGCFIPTTSPFTEMDVREKKIYNIGTKIYYLLTIQSMQSMYKNKAVYIVFRRHEPGGEENYIYSQGYSGSQVQYNIIMPMKNEYAELQKILSSCQ